MKWKGSDLDRMVVYMGATENKVVTLAAQVPLAQQAVPLQIVGPAAEEARIGQDLDAFLAGLDGRSSWLSEAERGEKISRLVGTRAGLLLGLGILVWWKHRRRRVGG